MTRFRKHLFAALFGLLFLPLVAQNAKAQSLPTGEVGGTGSFSLRANLLRWATLTPDLGIEWRINRLWGILVHGSWTSWSWSNKDRRYALWEVSPEVRHYIGKEKRGYPKCAII